jgi:hypothetical protein
VGEFVGNVPQSSETTEGLSFGWLNQVPKNENFVGSYGRVRDYRRYVYFVRAASSVRADMIFGKDSHPAPRAY